MSITSPPTWREKYPKSVSITGFVFIPVPLFRKDALVYKKSAGTSEILPSRGSRLPMQDNKHFPRAHEVYIVNIYNKDTGVQMFITPCIEIVEISG